MTLKVMKGADASSSIGLVIACFVRLNHKALAGRMNCKVVTNCKLQSSIMALQIDTIMKPPSKVLVGLADIYWVPSPRILLVS